MPSKSATDTLAARAARRSWAERLLPGNGSLALHHALILVAFVALWKALTVFGIMSPFFVGDPFVVFRRVFEWFASGTIFRHLWVTLLETVVAFLIGSALGLLAGLWLGLSEAASRLASPYLKGFNAMPRVILAPIFSVWFGLGMTSKIALGITLVFFVVFFNVYQGVKEVSPVTLANARMLGASRRQLLRSVYIPSATSWVFSSLHAAVGMAFVGAVIGEYMGSAAGVGYLILQAEGLFDINGVFAGVLLLTVFAVALDALVTVAERRLLHWQPRDAATVGGALT